MADEFNEQKQQDLKKLKDLTRDVRVAMLSTVDRDGCIRSRPMVAHQPDSDGFFWLLSCTSADIVGEISNEHQVNLSFAAPGANLYISVSGMAQTIEDQAKTGELWHPDYGAWFPDGPDDEGLILLRVSVEKVEYWDSPGGSGSHLATFQQSLAAGERYTSGESERLAPGQTRPANR